MVRPLDGNLSDPVRRRWIAPAGNYPLPLKVTLPLYTRKTRPTTSALLSQPAVPRTGPWADADFLPDRTRLVNLESLPLRRAGLGPVVPIAKPPRPPVR